MYLSDIFTIPVNLAGLPAISIPVKKNEQTSFSETCAGERAWCPERSGRQRVRGTSERARWASEAGLRGKIRRVRSIGFPTHRQAISRSWYFRNRAVLWTIRNMITDFINFYRKIIIFQIISFLISTILLGFIIYFIAKLNIVGEKIENLSMCLELKIFHGVGHWKLGNRFKNG